MTKQDLNGDGIWQRKSPELRLNLSTLQEAIDKNVEITQADIALDNAERRLPSLIAARNENMAWKAHPCEVNYLPKPEEEPKKEDPKQYGFEEMAAMMKPEQLQDLIKQLEDMQKEDDEKAALEGEDKDKPVEEPKDDDEDKAKPPSEQKAKKATAPISKPMSMQKATANVKPEEAAQEAGKQMTRQMSTMKPGEKEAQTKAAEVTEVKDDAAKAAEKATASAAAPQVKAPSLAQLSAKGVAIHLFGTSSDHSRLL